MTGSWHPLTNADCVYDVAFDPLQAGALQTVRAGDDKKGPAGNEPDVWDSPIWGYVWQGGYAMVVFGAIAFLLTLAQPVIQTMEDRFPRVSSPHAPHADGTAHLHGVVRLVEPELHFFRNVSPTFSQA